MPFPDFVLVWANNRADWLTPDGTPIGLIPAKGTIRRIDPKLFTWSADLGEDQGYKEGDHC
jgi:hypothetical protein